MDTNASVTFDLAGNGTDDDIRPYVQILRLDDEYLIEVSSNRFLTGVHRLNKAARQRLRELSFTRPSKEMPNHWIPVGDSDVVSWLVAEVLRDVIGAPHPAFLSGTPIPWGQENTTADLSVEPGSREQQRELIKQALVPMLGPDPTCDEDGDVPIRAGHSLVYPLVHPDAPVVAAARPAGRRREGSAPGPPIRHQAQP